jgi:hypothetical protein
MLMFGTTSPSGISLMANDIQNFVCAVKELGCPLDYYLIILLSHRPQIIVRSFAIIGGVTTIFKIQVLEGK